MGDKIKIGHFVSFGVGGADKCALNLIKGLLEIASDELEIIVFHNKYSHPTENELLSNPSRFPEYETLPIKIVKIEDVAELNNFDLDILHTHRSGNDTWFLPNFEQTEFNFKIIETNFHGYNLTKSDYRIYPSQAMVDKLQPCNIPYSIIPNPINKRIADSNLRNELDINDKFVYGRIARPDANIYTDVNLKAYKAIESNETCFLYAAPNIRAREDATKLNIKNIIFLEPTSDELMVSKTYNTFDVLCHSNLLGETFGNTIAEAMIHKKPVITHVGMSSWPQAHEELVGVCEELFVKTNIVETYSELMLKLKNDKWYYNEVANYLEDRALTLYDYVEVSKKYLIEYKKLYDEKRLVG